MGLHERILGKGRERIPDLAFRVMSVFLRVRHAIGGDKRVDELGIQRGDTVIDYGCGPGSYLPRASSLVGPNGKVLAVDVHPLAVASVRHLTETKGLTNVEPVLAEGYPLGLDEQVANLIYAFDMFHMVEDPSGFLQELHRLLQPDGVLVLESGHQRMSEARAKIEGSGLWTVVEESGNSFRCKPAKPAAIG